MGRTGVSASPVSRSCELREGVGGWVGGWVGAAAGEKGVLCSLRMAGLRFGVDVLCIQASKQADTQAGRR